jgi:hypothetical protein
MRVDYGDLWDWGGTNGMAGEVSSFVDSCSFIGSCTCVVRNNPICLALIRRQREEDLLPLCCITIHTISASMSTAERREFSL